MAATNRRDVQLVIRARDEATKALGAITGALDSLHSAQAGVASDSAKTSSGLAQVVSTIAAVEKAFGRTASAVDQAEASFAKQRASLAGVEGDYASLKAQVAAAAEAIVSLSIAQRNGDSGAAAKVDAAQAAYRNLSAQVERTSAVVAQQQAGLRASSETLATVKNAALAAGAALNSFGDDAQRAAAVNAAAAAKESEARQAVADSYAAQAAAARAEVTASRAQADINARLGISMAATAKSARESATAFEAADQAERQLAATAEQLRAELDPLGASQARFAVRLEEARKAMVAGKLTANEFAAAETHLAAEATRAAAAINGANGLKSDGTGAFLGLKPYELRNLGYQVNDVVTQIASGTSITQTFAQQGGQIFQILPGIGAKIVTLLPVIGLAVAGFGTLFAAFSRAGKNADELRDFTSALAGSADGAAYSAAALVKTAKALDAFGLSSADATAVTKSFVRDGLRPDAIVAFGRTAQNMADVLGIKVVDAAKQLGPAFNAGYDAVAKFDQATNFLTASQRENIKAMFDSGNAAGARALAYKLFADQQDDAARKSKGPWSDTFKNLGSAYNSFLDILADTRPIHAAIVLLTDLAAAARDAGEASSGKNTLAGLDSRIADLNAQEKSARENVTNKNPFTGELFAGIKDDIAAIIKQRNLLIAARDKLLAEAAKPLADTKAAASEAEKKAQDAAAQANAIARQSIGDLTDAQKIRLAGENAYRKSIEDTGDAVIASGAKQLAMAQEIERQRKAVNFGALAGKITGIESGGNASAKNSKSTATGLGQFVESTFVKLFTQYFPVQADGKTRDEILDLRNDAGISTKLVELYARQNAKVLEKAGLAVNEASLYLAHFLGPGGAVKVLSAAATTPISQLLGKGAINANRSVLGGSATAGSVVGFAQKKVGASDNDRAALDVQSAVINKLNTDSQKFNDTLDQRIQGWKDETTALGALANQETLSLEAKYAAKQADEVAKAITQANNEAIAANTTLTAARRAEITATVTALYSEKNAEALHNEQLALKKKAISDVIGLEQQRETAIKSLNDAYLQGESADNIAALKQQVADLTAQIVAALPQAEAFANALGDQRAIAALDNVNLKLKTVTTNIISTQQVNQALGQSIVGGFNTFTSEIAQGNSVFTSLKDGFLGFASSFLSSIAQMIIQAIAFKYILTALGLGGTGGFLAGIHHDGGLAGGTSNRTRSVSPFAFAGAMRYHSGGLAGLRPNEVPAILEKNEEVLTTSDPRHRFNAGSGGPAAAPQQNIKIVNTLDAGDFMSKGASTDVGERAIMNVLRANQNTLKSLVS